MSTKNKDKGFLDIGDGFIIESDRYCWILHEIRDTSRNNDTYYPTLKLLLSHNLDTRLKICKTVKDIFERIEKFEQIDIKELRRG